MTENFKERIYLKGKESLIVGFLLTVLVIIFVLPIVCFFVLRYVSKLICKVGSRNSETVVRRVPININQNIK